MNKTKVYVLQNAQKEYGRFDVYGWYKEESFVFATRFATRREAEQNVELFNYTLPCPDNLFFVVEKFIKIKSKGNDNEV
jgi:hypothetical protein